MTNKNIELGKRKIQKISKAHYINLPFIWMHNNNAKRGDELELCICPDGSLIISPPKKPHEQQAPRHKADKD